MSPDGLALRASVAAPAAAPSPGALVDTQLRFQTLPYVVLDQIAFFCGSPQLAHIRRQRFSLPQQAQPDADVFRLGETCSMLAFVTRPMRFHTLRIDNCAVDDDRMAWLAGREDLLPHVRHLTVGSKGLAGCRCPSKTFQSLVPHMIQLEQLQYRSKRPLTLGLAREFARLETLNSVFVSGTGFSSSPALAAFHDLRSLVLFPEQLGVFPRSPPQAAPPASDDTWDLTRRSFDLDAIQSVLVRSTDTLEQLYIAFGYKRDGDEARRIFELPAAAGSANVCGGSHCVATRTSSTTTLLLPHLRQLFLRTSDLSSDFFPSLLLGSPDLESLWITHAAASPSSHFAVPIAALPKLVELNVNLTSSPSLCDREGLRNLVKGKRLLKTLVLSEDAPLDTMFESEADGAGVESFTTWGGVSRHLLETVNAKMRGLRHLSFEGSDWADEDLALADVPSYLSNLKQLKTIELPCPLLPTPDIAPTFQQYLHESPVSRSQPDPWLEAAALTLFKSHLPSMMPAVRAFANQTAVQDLILVSEHTEWRWRLRPDEVELRMNFRSVLGGEVFGGGFSCSAAEAWSLGQSCAWFL